MNLDLSCYGHAALTLEFAATQSQQLSPEAVDRCDGSPLRREVEQHRCLRVIVISDCSKWYYLILANREV